ncbi:MAG: GNAT family N-acetyltransferase [Chloroflexota bacterium]
MQKSGRKSIWSGRVRPIQYFDERFDQFWRSVSPNFPIAVARSAKYLNYRYIENPRCGRYVCIVAEQASKIVGFIVLSLYDTPHSAYLLEFLIQPGLEAAGDALLQAVTQIAQSANAAQIYAWCPFHLKNEAALLSANGFVHATSKWMPGDLRYKQLFLIRKHPSLPSPLNLDANELENWYVSLGDHDYY